MVVVDYFLGFGDKEYIFGFFCYLCKGGDFLSYSKWNIEFVDVRGV